MTDPNTIIEAITQATKALESIQDALFRITLILVSICVATWATWATNK